MNYFVFLHNSSGTLFWKFQGVIVTITDRNDEIPECNNKLYYFNVDEELTNTGLYDHFTSDKEAVYNIIEYNSRLITCKVTELIIKCHQYN